MMQKGAGQKGKKGRVMKPMMEMKMPAGHGMKQQKEMQSQMGKMQKDMVAHMQGK